MKARVLAAISPRQREETALRMWPSGRASAFQADYGSSILLVRSQYTVRFTTAGLGFGRKNVREVVHNAEPLRSVNGGPGLWEHYKRR